MFQIKICGITSATDARVVADAGADAIGLNFYAGSPRCVSAEQASQIVRDLPSEVLRVGVFVNARPNEILALVERLQLDAVQLHGDEPPSAIGELTDIPVIRAVRCSIDRVNECLSHLERCQKTGRLPDALLIDADRRGHYGGTGHRADPGVLEKIREKYEKINLLLAGGLTPDNVEEAIGAEHPEGVDTASGVESSPGKKCPVKVRNFVARARSAFDRQARKK